MEVYESTLKWAEEFDQELYDLLVKYKDYCINISGLARKLLIEELSDSSKYKGE